MLPAIVAKNLRYFMDLSHYKNPNALATKAKIAPNSVRNLLDPLRRTVTDNKPIGAPQLDTLEKIAAILNIDVWKLLHPDIERALREEAFYRRIEQDYKSLKGDAA